MKNLLFVILLAPTIAMVSPSDNINSISKAIERGDAVALAQYFDENVEIAILDDEDIYGRAEAKQVVQAFFAKNQPKSYSPVHKGVSKKEEAQYSIGNLVANSGSFRVYVYMKVDQGKYTIQELRFDKE